jgi:hypothetical protein
MKKLFVLLALCLMGCSEAQAQMVGLPSDALTCPLASVVSKRVMRSMCIGEGCTYQPACRVFTCVRKGSTAARYWTIPAMPTPHLNAVGYRVSDAQATASDPVCSGGAAFLHGSSAWSAP